MYSPIKIKIERWCLIIKKLEFSDFCDFVDELLERYDEEKSFKKSDFIGVSVVGYYNVIIEVLNTLVKTSDFDLFDIKICDSDIDGYGDLYTLSLSEDNKIFVQEAKYPNGYINFEGDLVFIHSDSNSKFIVENKNTNFIEFDIKSDDEDCNCDNCYDDNSLYTNTSNGESTYISKTEDGKVAGFSKTWTTTKDNVTCTSSYSHYSTDEDIVKKIARDFGIEI